MVYASQQDMIKAFGERELVDLTDRNDPRTHLVDAEVVTAALEAASAKIDGYIGNRYKLPLATVPAVLKGACCDLARYELWDINAPEIVVQRRKDAIQLLKDISNGVLGLGADAAGASVVEESSNTISMQSGGKVFGRERFDCDDDIPRRRLY
jgi:phage gp36-like protein